jgi:hypothetical protein
VRKGVEKRDKPNEPSSSQKSWDYKYSRAQ